MNRLMTLIIAVMLSAPTATAQDVSLHAFAGRTAPAVQDADFFSRSFQGGVTLGVGAGIPLTRHVAVEVNLSYQRFILDSPAAVLKNNGFEGGGASFRLAGPYNIFAQEVNVQYTFRPGGAVQPYLTGGLLAQYEHNEGVDVRGDAGGIRVGETSVPSRGRQGGGGVQGALAARVAAFVEALIHTDSNSNHTLPVRGGLSIGL